MTTPYLENVLISSASALRTKNQELRDFLQYLIARAGNLAKAKNTTADNNFMLEALKKEKKELDNTIQTYVNMGVDIEDLTAAPLDLIKALEQRVIVDSFLPAVFTSEEVNNFLLMLPHGQQKGYYVKEAKQFEVSQGKLFDMAMFMANLDVWMKSI
jgi:hypothetical protein